MIWCESVCPVAATSSINLPRPMHSLPPLQLRKKTAALEAEHAAAKAALQSKLEEQSKEVQEALAKAAAAEEAERKRAEALEAANAACKEAQEQATQVRQAGAV